jgi:hypothetical protein
VRESDWKSDSAGAAERVPASLTRDVRGRNSGLVRPLFDGEQLRTTRRLDEARIREATRGSGLGEPVDGLGFGVKQLGKLVPVTTREVKDLFSRVDRKFVESARRKGEARMAAYRARKNAESIDGLPGLEPILVPEDGGNGRSEA